MEDIRVKRKDKTKISWLKFKIFVLRNKWYIVGVILLATIIIFPSLSGEQIGKFITRFVGGIVKNIHI